jgi:hypothetical protein
MKVPFTQYKKRRHYHEDRQMQDLWQETHQSGQLYTRNRTRLLQKISLTHRSLIKERIASGNTCRNLISYIHFHVYLSLLPHTDTINGIKKPKTF